MKTEKKTDNEKIKELELDWKIAIQLGNFKKAKEIDAKVEMLIEKENGANFKGASLRNLTEIFEYLVKDNIVMKMFFKRNQIINHLCNENLNKHSSIIMKFIPRPQDIHERYIADRKLVIKHLNIFNESVIGTLIGIINYEIPEDILSKLQVSESVISKNSVYIFLERVCEVLYHVTDIKGKENEKLHICFKGGEISENIGNIEGSMYWHDLARSISKIVGEDKAYLAATFNFARACMICSRKNLEYLIIPALEDARLYSKKLNDKDILQRTINNLLEFYNPNHDECEIQILRKELLSTL